MVSVDTLVLLVVVVLLVPSLLAGLAAGYATARLFGLPSQLRVYGDYAGVDRWSALLPTVLALSVVVAVEFLASIPSDGAPGSSLANAAVALVLVGAFGLSVGLANLRGYLRVRSVTEAIDVDDGRVTVSGTAEAPPGGTTEGPLSGEPCLAWAVRVREYRGLGHRGIRGLSHADHGGVAFPVRDGTGTVRVDPAAVALTGWPLPPRSGDFAADTRRETPERVAAYRDAHDLGDGDTRIYEELRLTAGTDVTATGTVETRDGRVTLGEPGSLRRAPARTVRQSRKRRVLVGVAGTVTMVAATLLLTSVVGLL